MDYAREISESDSNPVPSPSSVWRLDLRAGRISENRFE